MEQYHTNGGLVLGYSYGAELRGAPGQVIWAYLAQGGAMPLGDPDQDNWGSDEWRNFYISVAGSSRVITSAKTTDAPSRPAARPASTEQRIGGVVAAQLLTTTSSPLGRRVAIWVAVHCRSARFSRVRASEPTCAANAYELLRTRSAQALNPRVRVRVLGTKYRSALARADHCPAMPNSSSMASAPVVMTGRNSFL